MLGSTPAGATTKRSMGRPKKYNNEEERKEARKIQAEKRKIRHLEELETSRWLENRGAERGRRKSFCKYCCTYDCGQMHE